MLEALLADCHADTRMPLLARFAANVPLEQRLKARWAMATMASAHSCCCK